LDKLTRSEVQDFFDNSWTLSEVLFSGLNGEEGFFRAPPHDLRHPQIFYYAHSPVLYVNKLKIAGLLDPINPAIESTCEIGVDEYLWDDMNKNHSAWPSVSEVTEYRRDVYRAVSQIIAEHPDLGNGTPITQDHPLWALFMAMEHDRIHVETSSVLFREMCVSNFQPPPHWAPLHPSSAGAAASSVAPREGVDYPANQMLAVNKTISELGKREDFPSYGWDNEYGQRSVEVPAFEADKFLVSNGEFWQFVSDGGYSNPDYWSSEGKKKKRAQFRIRGVNVFER
jgi:hypothetical protein